MPTVTIEDKGCRGCTLCVDVCPCDVFELETHGDGELARVVHTEDCIGCFSCYYRCPSQCITIEDAVMQRPFYRIEENVAFVEKFLQTPSATTTLTEDDWEEAYRDLAMTVMALSRASAKLMGRGIRALGRRAGSVSAEHLPEIYEETDLEGVLRSLQQRFRHCFDFEYTVQNDEVEMRFVPCSLNLVVSEAGQPVGEAVACKLFHDFLAGLVSAYSGEGYRCNVKSVGEQCHLVLHQV